MNKFRWLLSFWYLIGGGVENLKFIAKNLLPEKKFNLVVDYLEIHVLQAQHNPSTILLRRKGDKKKEWWLACVDKYSSMERISCRKKSKREYPW